MSEENKVPGGQPESEAGGKTKEEKHVVAYESFVKVLDEKKSLQAKLQEYERLRKEDEERKLNEKGEYKKILELREKELEETRLKLEKVSNEKIETEGDLRDTWKLQAFYQELPGKVKKSEYLSFIDLESIVLDPETRQIDKASVKNAVSNFMENYSDLVDTKTFKGLPGNSAQSPSKLTIDEWQKLPIKERRSRMGDVQM